MARDNHIVLSDDELENLQDARNSMFHTDQVPYGVVIQQLIEQNDA